MYYFISFYFFKIISLNNINIFSNFIYLRYIANKCKNKKKAKEIIKF